MHSQSISALILPCLIVLAIGCSDSDSGKVEQDNPKGDESASNGGLADSLPTIQKEPKHVENSTKHAQLGFTNIQPDNKLDYEYINGAAGRKLMVESTGGGGGWIDFDLDGLIDFYLPQGGNPTHKNSEDQQPLDRLYRNMGVSQAVTEFVDVSAMTIPPGIEYGQGIAVGDYDNDGFPDVYISNVGKNSLLRNLGDGTFEDVTAEAGVGNELWGTSCAWGDIDQDGDLDLWLCNYLIYDVYNPPPCRNSAGEPATCHPGQLDPQPNELYINNGDGTFEGVYQKWGLAKKGAKSLGVTISDFDRDGRPDVFVANDTTANFLYRNLGPHDKKKGQLRLEESGHPRGCAISGLGEMQASMGIGFGDFDKNGFQDLYISHFTADSNTLYVNLGTTGFVDQTRETDLHSPTLKYLGFGAVMADFNYDRQMDLLVTNGHIDDWRKTKNDLWKMPAQLFSFDGKNWIEKSSQAGPYFQKDWIGRCVATADFDNDNDVDVLIVHQNDKLGLLRNDEVHGHWLRIKPIGIASNRDAFNAIVTVKQGSEQLVQERAGGTSYCAAHEPVLTFGLGSMDDDCVVEIEWPSGHTQVLPKIPVDQTVVVLEQLADSAKTNRN